MDYSAGREARSFQLRQPELHLAPLICFEDTVSGVARRFVRNGPVDLFVNMTNDGWFRHPRNRDNISTMPCSVVWNFVVPCCGSRTMG
ncbi:MAG: hypothetical protein HC904_14960 [Blastochloris sp.]|nr:hypothetical protein [Blastochloris sp.]